MAGGMIYPDLSDIKPYHKYPKSVQKPCNGITLELHHLSTPSHHSAGLRAKEAPFLIFHLTLQNNKLDPLTESHLIFVRYYHS